MELESNTIFFNNLKWYCLKTDEQNEDGNLGFVDMLYSDSNIADGNIQVGILFYHN